MSEYLTPSTREAMERYRRPTRGEALRRYLVPIIGVGGVTTLAATLILLVVLRAIPGLGVIFTPDTHGNLWKEVKPGYNRTELAMVTAPMEGAFPAHPTSGPLPQGLSQRDLGERLFSGVGCAMCHGLQGEGGAIAPPIAGANPELVKAMVRFGPGGMPAFSEEVLPEKELDAIIAYLHSLGPSEPPQQEPSAPAQAEPPQEEVGAPAPTAPGPQAQPSTDLGQRVFSRVGCAMCHGSQGEGNAMAPPIAGADAKLVKATVRSGRGGMPPFSPDRVSEEELAAVIAYLQVLAEEKP